MPPFSVAGISLSPPSRRGYIKIKFVLDKERNVLYLFAYELINLLQSFTIVNIALKGEEFCNPYIIHHWYSQRRSTWETRKKDFQPLRAYEGLVPMVR